MNPVLLVSQIVLLYYYLEISQNCIASASNWNRFVTSRNYSNLKLTTSLNYFTPRYTPKNLPASSVKLHCSLACANDETCRAFNFYETDTSYICELLADNYCANFGTLGLANFPGSTIWDKILNASRKLTCLDAMFAAGKTLACGVMRPGCLGNWPNCYNCTRSCIDCDARNMTNCIFWPEGNPALTPVTGHCYYRQTYLVDRSVDLTTGVVSSDYQMSFQDMRRTLASGVHKQLQFWFMYSNNWHYSTYLNASIFDNGTWESMHFFNQPSPYTNYIPAVDVFSLNGSAPLKRMPFVTVTDDRYGCGSFWLLDPDNATYCPGGKVSMWGTPKMSGGMAIYAGIKFPQAPAGRRIFNIGSREWNRNNLNSQGSGFLCNGNGRPLWMWVWLLDPNNATYCPGGNTSMWGTPKMRGGKAIYGGIRFPSAPSGSIFKYTQILLGDMLL